MNIKYLGTSASEGFPALFCNCEICREARRLMGKNIRTRSQVMIDRKLLIDFPADTFSHCLQNGIDFTAIKGVLVTHSHFDHFSPTDLTLRGEYNSFDRVEPVLEVVCNERTKTMYDVITCCDCDAVLKQNLVFKVLSVYEQAECGGYLVTALPANHTECEKSFLYLIENNNKTYLHACDTGNVEKGMLDVMEKSGIRLDAVTCDCTFGLQTAGKNGHMGLSNICEFKRELLQRGIAGIGTKFVATHFSHICNSLYEELAEAGEREGILIAYDGMELEI